jgi:hypothetical protein
MDIPRRGVLAQSRGVEYDYTRREGFIDGCGQSARQLTCKKRASPHVHRYRHGCWFCRVRNVKPASPNPSRCVAPRVSICWTRGVSTVNPTKPYSTFSTVAVEGCSSDYPSRRCSYWQISISHCGKGLRWDTCGDSMGCEKATQA